MQIKTEKDALPLRKAIIGFLTIFFLYALLAFGIPYWFYDHALSQAGLVRWINLLLVPFAASLVLGRTSRRARIYFTHLTQKDLIQRRLVEVLRQDGYRITEALAHQVYFRSTLPFRGFLKISKPLWMEFEEDYILLHGPWSKIQKLEKMAYEGEIFLPKSR